MSLSQQYYSDDSDDSIAETTTAPTIIKKRTVESGRNQKSKYKGVFRVGKKFKAQIQTNGVQHYLGLYDTEDEAAIAYDKHSREVLGLKAKTNFDSNLDLIGDDVTSGLRNVHDQMELSKPRGSHPRRTYVGIKSKRKRLSSGNTESGDDASSSSGAIGMLRVSAMQSVQNDQPEYVSFAMRMRDEEWRKRSYFWFGALAYDPSALMVFWKGSFLSYTKTRPTAEQLQWSRNFFEYTGPSCVDGGDMMSSTGLRPLSGKYTGSHILDDGNGRQEKISDQFELDFREILGTMPVQFTVVGLGTSEFGSFVLDGAYDSGSRALALSRNFVAPSDPLGVMNLNDLKKYHGRQLCAVQNDMTAQMGVSSNGVQQTAAAVPQTAAAMHTTMPVTNMEQQQPAVVPVDIAEVALV